MVCFCCCCCIYFHPLISTLATVYLLLHLHKCQQPSHPVTPLWQTPSYIFSIRVIPLIAFLSSPCLKFIHHFRYVSLKQQIAYYDHLQYNHYYISPTPRPYRPSVSPLPLRVSVCTLNHYLSTRNSLIPFLVHQPTTTWQAPKVLNLINPCTATSPFHSPRARDSTAPCAVSRST